MTGPRKIGHPRSGPRTVVAWLGLSAALALASCVEAPPPLPENMTAADQASCVASGGRIERDGLQGLQVCYRDFTDGGKICRKSTDCQGACIVDGEAAVQGSCAPQTVFYGCSWWMDENGKPTGGVCVD